MLWQVPLARVAAVEMPASPTAAVLRLSLVADGSALPGGKTKSLAVDCLTPAVVPLVRDTIEAARSGAQS